MKKVNLKVATSVAAETGGLLKTYLKERGVYSVSSNVTVCYGIHDEEQPNLNGNCGRGKIYNLECLRQNGVRTVPWFSANAVPKDITFPLLARKNHGYGGTDLVPVFQREEIIWRIAAGWDWFSEYVPLQTEFRVWIFRNQFLDIYEKQMRRPEDYKYIGRNFRNGFDFVLTGRGSLEEEAAILEAKCALAALELDFGAVDVLLGKDGWAYILEVNTAPGVIKSRAQQTLGKLADCIVEWAKADCPER